MESSAVQTLKATAVSTSSAVTSWNSVPGATGYRLAWGPTAGTSKQPPLFSSSFFTLSRTWPFPLWFLCHYFHSLFLPVSLIYSLFFTPATGRWQHEVSLRRPVTHAFTLGEFMRARLKERHVRGMNRWHLGSRPKEGFESNSSPSPWWAPGPCIKRSNPEDGCYEGGLLWLIPRALTDSYRWVWWWVRGKVRTREGKWDRSSWSSRMKDKREQVTWHHLMSSISIYSTVEWGPNACDFIENTWQDSRF